MRTFLLLFLSFSFQFAKAQEIISFTKVEDVFSYANTHNTALLNGEQQTLIAKYQLLAAKVGVINLKADANASLTDNLQLTTSFIPAEIFGGPSGSYRAVTFGQQYITNVGISPQFDIINPNIIGRIKTAKTYQSMTEAGNLITKKNLYESLAACYFNIVSYQWQLDISKKNLENADTLVSIYSNKHNEGIIRAQELNNVLSNQLFIRDRVQQLESQIEIQKENLILLCDLPLHTKLVINVKTDNATNLASPSYPNFNLNEKQAYWQREYEKSQLRSSIKWFLPTISVVGNLAWMQSTNHKFLDDKPFYRSSFVGLKMLLPIIPDVNKIATVRNNRINLQIATNTLNHAALQDSILNHQLMLDFQSAQKSWQLASQIESFSNDSYQKNLQLFKAGIIGSSELLTSFNETLTNSLNRATKEASARFVRAKILINQLIK